MAASEVVAMKTSEVREKVDEDGKQGGSTHQPARLRRSD